MFILNRNKSTIKAIYNVLHYNGYQGSIINHIHLQDQILTISIVLPYNKDSIQLEELLQNLQEQLKAFDIRISTKQGKQITLQCSYKDLTNLIYNESYLTYDSLKLRIPTTFGTTTIDYYDSASCHMLNGGTTRMGKTYLLLFIITTLYIQNKANIQFYIATAKPKDFYPFQNKRNIQVLSDHKQLEATLEEINNQYQQRLNLINSPDLFNCVDAKDVLKKKPSYKQHFQPIFLIIDEYARYSDNKDIQKQVTQLVETTGYLNIHVIISTQRTDAKTVLNPRIKANLLVRIAFTTTDRANSLLILDTEGAERLGRIAGRGLLLNGELETIQIPKMDYNQINKLLEPYKEENKHDNEHTKNSENKGSTNHQLSRKMESLFNESNSENIL